MDNSNYWPYTNIHELNLDWIIAKVKELDTRFTDDIETFVREYIDEHFAEWTVNANYDPDDETIIYTNGTGATLTAGDVIRFAIDNAFVNVKDPTARAAASAAQSTADSATTAAAAAQRTADNNTAEIALINNKLSSSRASLTRNDPQNVIKSLYLGEVVKYGNIKIATIIFAVSPSTTATIDSWTPILTLPEGYGASYITEAAGIRTDGNAQASFHVVENSISIVLSAQPSSAYTIRTQLVFI